MCNILFLVFTITFSLREYKYPIEMLILHSANMIMGQLIKIHLTSVNLLLSSLHFLVATDKSEQAQDREQGQ